MEERPPEVPLPIMEVPRPIPEISKKGLWFMLLIPPLATILAGFALTSVGPGFMILSPLLILAGLVHATTLFSSLVGKRYRGNSLVFLILAYFVGEIIVCLMFWLGVCLLAFSSF